MSLRCRQYAVLFGASSAVVSVWVTILTTKQLDIYKYIVAVVHGLACLLMFLCCPKLIELMHRQSIRLEDFDIKRGDSLTRQFKKRQLKKLFRIALSITTACTVGFTVEFAYVRIFIVPESTSLIEIIGIVGGTLSMLKRVHLLTGRYLLHGLGCYLKKNTGEEKTDNAAEDQASN